MLAYKGKVFFTSIVLFVIGYPDSRAAVPTLPVPSDYTYEVNFSYLIARVVTGDLNNDGLLDFVEKSDHTGAGNTVRIEARLNNGTKLWEFDTQVDINLNSNALDVPMTCWDFNGDGKWEVYIQYYNGERRHRIVDGETGQPLIDDAFPAWWGDQKSMVAICYRNNIPRIVSYIDYELHMRMFETWTGSQWSLNLMWDKTRSPNMIHDMFRTADVDLDGSDDEILAGINVYNADGSLRYAMPSNCEGSDQAMLGYFSSQSKELIYVTGTHNCQNSTSIFAAWAKTGQIIWEVNAWDYFNDWTHWHSGWLADVDGSVPGAEATVIDRNTSAWLKIAVETGQVLDYWNGSNNPAWCKPVMWSSGTHYDCTVNTVDWNLEIRADVGGTGGEEVWGLNGPNNLVIFFNQNAPAIPSQWENRHYRQDAALFASGYSARWVNPQVIPDGTPTVDNTPPTISQVSVKSVTSLEVVFNEAVQSASAENTNNYFIDGGIGIPSQAILANGNRVTLTVSNLTMNQTYLLTVNNVKDTAGNTIAANTTKNFQFLAQGLPLDFMGTAVGTEKSVTIPLSNLTQFTNAILVITGTDIDAAAEIELRINGQGPVTLPAGAILLDGGTLTDSVNIDKSLLMEGQNILTFKFASNLGGTTSGFVIENAAIYLRQGPIDLKKIAAQNLNNIRFDNFPNPFYDETEFYISVNGRAPLSVPATLTIYDMKGQVVKSIKGITRERVLWKTGGEVAGIYSAVLQIENAALYKKIILLK